MELRRKAYGELKKWKSESNGTTALLINGARRVGKSHLAREFGKNEYKTYIIINFANDEPQYKKLFEDDIYDLDMFFNKLSVMKGVSLHKRDSLIILDEIQCFPLARQRIKTLVADGRYDYIETGSLLSIKTNVRDILIPSEEYHFRLDPLDLEEFLWAMGDNISGPYLRECFEKRIPVGDVVHKKMMNRVREHMLVGGMPEAVSVYADTRDFEKADRVKKTILNLYRNDVTKFAVGYESRVKILYDTIPAQLSKKEKKFKISSLDKNAKNRTYEDAFMWLSDGMIINQCFNATDPTTVLSMSLDSTSQKCYMEDTGLLVTHSLFDRDYADNTLYKSILMDKLNINEGMLTENYVSQALKTNRHRLFFYSRYKTENTEAIEIDFLITRAGKVCPIEVKSSDSKRHVSLDRFISKFKKHVGESFVICPKDLKIRNGITYIPLYMAMFL